VDQELMALSESRAGLPEFAGATLTERLINGRNEARARLLKYTSKIRFSSGSADDLLHEINSWQERNAAIIKQRMSDPATDTLPEQIALEFGAKKAQQYVLAGYSVAAEGLGPWTSGKLLQLMSSAEHPVITEPWLREDADARLNLFASVVKLDDDGDLAVIFDPETYAQRQQVQGLGTLPAIIAAVGGKWVVMGLVLMFLGTVALFLMYAFSTEKVRLNNKLQAEICQKAQSQGDKGTVAACVEAAAAAQDNPLGDITGDITKIALIVGAVYVGAKVLPDLLKQRGARRAPA